jgi:N utilization substance protein B
MARLPRVSLAILRISCAQLMFMPDIPQSVVINEAVELAKEYGGESEYSFVNGALRSICGSLGPGQ